ncbi:MAG: hypothetical protein M1815_004685 [Lichina confinis]|nr:MAG: hypothetical protein M1815_004685 [Lichina confinis]
MGDRQIDVARLETINYARLSAKDPNELDKLVKAAGSPGFFYLDFRDAASTPILDELQQVYGIEERYFDQPRDVKTQHQRKGEGRGYKAGGPNPGEAFEIARDEVTQTSRALPGLFGDHAELFERFMRDCDAAVQTMLSRLSEGLGLEQEDRLEKVHRVSEASDCGLLLAYQPWGTDSDLGENWHNDTGSLTLLFCERWAVQIELPETKEQLRIEARPGHAIVNVADTLQKLSGDRLRSCRHQVVKPADGAQKQYFAVYYLRPETASA